MSRNNIAVFFFPATANPQQTAGVTDTNPGAPPASELSPARNGPDSVDDGATASENDDNNGTQQLASINSIIFLVLNDAIQCTWLAECMVSWLRIRIFFLVSVFLLTSISQAAHSIIVQTWIILYSDLGRDRSSGDLCL